MNTFLNILIFLCEIIGVVLIGIGLQKIWDPLCWIYSGAVVFLCGWLLYQEKNSEESDK